MDRDFVYDSTLKKVGKKRVSESQLCDKLWRQSFLRQQKSSYSIAKANCSCTPLKPDKFSELFWHNMQKI